MLMHRTGCCRVGGSDQEAAADATGEAQRHHQAHGQTDRQHPGGPRLQTAAVCCLSLTACVNGGQEQRQEARLFSDPPPGADGSSQHPVADWRILRARPQDRPRRAEEDGQVVHQRRRHCQTANHQLGRQALSHQLQTGVNGAVFVCRRHSKWFRIHKYVRLAW